MNRDLQIIKEISRIPVRQMLRPEDKLGFTLAAISAASITDPAIAREATRIIQNLEILHEEIITDSDVREQLKNSDGLPGLGAFVPSSHSFLRESLPWGDRAAEEGSAVDYQRPADSEVWARHVACCKERKVNKLATGSSMLSRDEAKFYLKRGFFPAHWELRFERKRGRNAWG